MKFTPQFLDDIRARISLADVVGKRVKLQRAGREWKGLCPFHNEKTPSFSVVEDKGFFHCFGCGAHGDVIGFVMRTEGLSFPETVERLAGEAGLAMPVTSPEERERFSARDGLMKAVEAACAYYEHQLRTSGGREAHEYLKGRGLSDETIARFRLGYAPRGNDALKTKLLKDGFDEATLLQAALISKPEDGRASYDFFRHRITFPIADPRGRVIAFGARALGDGQPKYLNSRDSDIFHKGQALYGLALAREAARSDKEVIAVEGYMDVIALHQVGLAGAVAPLGTALTESQIELLWRLAPEPVLCFDGDTAGRRAAARAAERSLPLLRPGVSLRFSILPPGEDPDSMVQSRGPAAFNRRIERAMRLGEWLWEVIAGGKRIASWEEAAAIEKEIDEKSDQVAERRSQFYFRVFLKRKLFNAIWDRRDKKEKSEVITLRTDVEPEELAHLKQKGLVAALINHPELIEMNEDGLEKLRLSDQKLDCLFEAILSVVRDQVELDRDGMIAALTTQGFGDVLKQVLADRVYWTVPFASPLAKEEMLDAAWKEAFGQIAIEQLNKDLAQAEVELARDLSADRLKIINKIKEQIWQASHELDADH